MSPLAGLYVRAVLKHQKQREQRRKERLKRKRKLFYLFQQWQTDEMFLFFCLMGVVSSEVPPPNRQIWSVPKSDRWWNYVVQTFTEAEWIKHFRMSKTTFNYLVNNLRPYIAKKDTRLRQAVEVDRRVALTLWRLATNAEYRTIGQLFGVGTSTVCNIVHQVCEAIVEVLGRDLIRIPQGEAALEVVRGFEARWGFPQCFGAVDGSHIPIQARKPYPSDFYNRKGFHSIVLQGLVDHVYRFMNVNFKYPGSVHDARVFGKSCIYMQGQTGRLCPPNPREVGGTTVPVVILGDSAYPLLKWLMKPFNDNGQLTREKRLYNYHLSRARMVVENAFGRLKGRWRILLKRNDTSLEYFENVVIACCVLHNLCESSGEPFNDELPMREDPGQDPDHHVEIPTEDASLVRNAFVQHFAAAR